MKKLLSMLMLLAVALAAALPAHAADETVTLGLPVDGKVRIYSSITENTYSLKWNYNGSQTYTDNATWENNYFSQSVITLDLMSGSQSLVNVAFLNSNQQQEPHTSENGFVSLPIDHYVRIYSPSKSLKSFSITIKGNVANPYSAFTYYYADSKAEYNSTTGYTTLTYSNISTQQADLQSCLSDITYGDMQIVGMSFTWEGPLDVPVFAEESLTKDENGYPYYDSGTNTYYYTDNQTTDYKAPVRFNAPGANSLIYYSGTPQSAGTNYSVTVSNGTATINIPIEGGSTVGYNSTITVLSQNASGKQSQPFTFKVYHMPVPLAAPTVATVPGQDNYITQTGDFAYEYCDGGIEPGEIFNQSVTFKFPEGTASARYTTDGSDPTTGGKTITVDPGTLLGTIELQTTLYQTTNLKVVAIENIEGKNYPGKVHKSVWKHVVTPVPARPLINRYRKATATGSASIDPEGEIVMSGSNDWLELFVDRAAGETVYGRLQTSPPTEEQTTAPGTLGKLAFTQSSQSAEGECVKFVPQDIINATRSASAYLVMAKANRFGKFSSIVYYKISFAGPEIPSLELQSGYRMDGNDIVIVNNSLQARITHPANDINVNVEAQFVTPDAVGNYKIDETKWVLCTSYPGSSGIYYDLQPINATGRLFMRAYTQVGSYTDSYNNTRYVNAYSDIVYRDFTLKAATALSLSAITGAEAKQQWLAAHGNNALVQTSDRLKVMGYYTTNAPGNPFYLYLANQSGNVIKVVGQWPAGASSVRSTLERAMSTQNNASDIRTPWVIPAGGITGYLEFIDGTRLVEIHTEGTSDSYINFLQAPAQQLASAPDFFNAEGKALQYPGVRTSIDPDIDFNRYVEIRSLKWTGAKNEVEMKDGTLRPLYTRLQGTYTFNPDKLGTDGKPILEEGKLYRVKGFIGQADGDISIFPVEDPQQCPGTPDLFAPNPVGQPANPGDFIDVKAISDVVTFTVSGHAYGATGFKYRVIGKDTEPQPVEADNTFDVDLSALADGKTVELEVYGYLNGMESIEPARVRITKRTAEPVNSIHDFKNKVLGNIEANKDKIYQLTDGTVLVEEITDKYLYVRDYAADNKEIANGADGYLRRLLILNNNKWLAHITAGNEEREIKVGDILSGFALIADDNEGNIVSNSTGFARTFKYKGHDDTQIGVTEEREVNSLDGTAFEFTNSDRMRMLTLKGVTVAKSGSGTDTDPFVYTLNLKPGSEARMRIGDPFQFRGAWQEAYKENTPFDITGVVLIDGEGTGKFAFAPLSFEGLRKLNTPAVYLSSIDESKRGDIEQPFTTGSIIMDTPKTAPEGAKIYYSTNGLDPLHNLGSRKEYTDKIELGDSTVEIRAFVAAPGYTPSDIVVRRFTKSSHDVQFILNFLQTAQPGQTYRFTGETRVVAIGGDYIFVAGRVGHYLPIRRTGGWADRADITPGSYLSGFTVGYEVDANGNRMAVADGFESTFRPQTSGAAVITPVPDEADALDFATHPRRLVRLRNVTVNSLATPGEGGNLQIAWTLTEDSDGETHSLMPGKLGAVKIIERDSEGNPVAESSEFVNGESYNVVGFVMLNSAREATMEMWPVEATHLRRTSEVKASMSNVVNTQTDTEGTIFAQFEDMTMVTLSCDTRNAVIYYALGEGPDNLTWYEYQRPFAVTADEYIHAKAIAPNAIESGHTHISLIRRTEAGDVTITVDNSTAGQAKVTMASAETGTIIYWTSNDKREKTYTAPVVFDRTLIVYARLKVSGKTDGAVCHALVEIVPVTPENPDGPEDIEAKGNSLRFSQTVTEEGWAVVTIEPVTPVEGGTIYYTTEVGKKLPSEGIKYEKPIIMKESGVIIAIMTIEGKPASQAYETTVWVVPVTTGIEGIEGEGSGSVRVDGSDIIAPEGSEVFDLNGRRVNPTGLESGVYIVRTPSGKAVKVRL